MCAVMPTVVFESVGKLTRSLSLRRVREGESPDHAALVMENCVTSPRTVDSFVEKTGGGSTGSTVL
jgi:hypothetical protein